MGSDMIAERKLVDVQRIDGICNVGMHSLIYLTLTEVTGV